jgi:hypothetical protein
MKKNIPYHTYIISGITFLILILVFRAYIISEPTLQSSVHDVISSVSPSVVMIVDV